MFPSPSRVEYLCPTDLPPPPQTLIRGWLQVFDLKAQTASCPKKANTGSVGFEGFSFYTTVTITPE